MALAVPLGYQLAGFGVDGAGVAPTEVNTESHTRKTVDERVVGVDGSLEVYFGVFAAGAHSIQRYFIDVGGVAGRVDLYVPAAGDHQFLNHLTLNSDNIGNEVIEVF